MTSPLEKLRAIARNTPSPYERNEKSRPELSHERPLSFNSFISSSEDPPKRAGVDEQDARFGARSHADDRAERANTPESKPGIPGESFGALSGRHPSSADAAWSPGQLLASARNTSHPPYERNERTLSVPPIERLLSFNSFISSPDNPAKLAGAGRRGERFGPSSPADNRGERANTAESEPGIQGKDFAELSSSPVGAGCSLGQLLVSSPNRSHPPYEKNERNEISPSETPPARLLWFNAFLAASEEAGSPEDRTDPKTWFRAFAGMIGAPTPTGFSDRRWQRIIDSAGRFLDRWAGVASACGWSDLDIFGCHPDRPDARFDCMGIVLLLDRCEVVGVDEAGADVVTNTGFPQRFSRRPLPAATISLWQLVKKR